jgi:hypothetical protein
METIKLTTRIDQTGVLRLELPSHLANQDVEVLVVVQPVHAPTASGWPADYFAAIDAIEADDMIERPDQYAVTG